MGNGKGAVQMTDTKPDLCSMHGIDDCRRCAAERAAASAVPINPLMTTEQASALRASLGCWTEQRPSQQPVLYVAGNEQP